MIASAALSFGMHVLMSSFRVLAAPIGHVLDLVLPHTYRNMATKAVKGTINFNTKHLKKGDPQPPYTGKLRVYNMRYCPYAQRTILALNAKEIDYEVVNIDLMQKPEWLTTVSAFGKVPSLEIAKNVCIYESLVTVEYLEEVYPQRPLLPKDPVKKAYDKIIIESTGPIHSLFYKLIKDQPVSEDNITAYNKALEFIQDQLKSRRTKFLDGSEPGFADYMIWPWFERILVFKELDNRAEIDSNKFKLLLEYLKNMEQDPAVSQYLIPKEISLKFFNGFKNGTPDYDMMLQN